MFRDAGSPRMDKLVREVGAGAAAVVGLSAGLQLLGGLVANPTSRALFGAILVGFVANRIGIAAPASRRVALRRTLLGAALGSAIALALLALSLGTGATLRSTGLGLSAPLGLAELGAAAYRDELCLRGLPLTFGERAGAPRWAILAFMALSGLCAVALQPGARLAGLALAGASSFAFASLWFVTGSLPAPVAAHAAWKIAADVLLAGDPLDLSRPLPTGPRASGALAWASAAMFIIVAALSLRNKRAARP